MTFTQAIRTCFRKYVTFSGRASRAEFWYFFPVGVLLPILALGGAFVLGLGLYWTVALMSLCGLPLFAAGARRLQDTGEVDAAAYKPWMSCAIAVVLGSWSYQALTTVQWAFAQQEPLDGPGGFAFVVIYGYGGALLGIIAAVIGLFFLSTITPAFAQTIVPSQPGPNKYGPYPHEVEP